ncbi:MAG: rhodanese-like domain-containing protein [Actinomycetota bacterium]|nr:MAG: rhodanese-like domain-containing protein [Actinomycetota bacterium]
MGEVGLPPAARHQHAARAVPVVLPSGRRGDRRGGRVPARRARAAPSLRRRPPPTHRVNARPRLCHTLVGAAAIIAAGVVLGLVANGVAGSGLPLARESGRPGETVTVDAARSAQRRGAALIDARPREDYLSGHIDGAISVPFASRQSERDRLRSELPRTRRLIVYCEGGDCRAAGDLSVWLLAEGWRDVRVLEGGYPVWEAAGFPVRTGGSP